MKLLLAGRSRRSVWCALGQSHLVHEAGQLGHGRHENVWGVLETIAIRSSFNMFYRLHDGGHCLRQGVTKLQRDCELAKAQESLGIQPSMDPAGPGVQVI